MKAAAILERLKGLPAPSPAVVKLIHSLNQPDSDTEEVVRVVEKDPVLTAKLLAVCNSANVGSSQRIASIKQAIFYMGFKEVYRLTLSISFGGPLAQSLDRYAIQDNELWRHSLVTALATQSVLARSSVSELDPSVAYTAGLVHDIGKIAMNQVLDEAIEGNIRREVERGNASRIEAERRELGTDHCEVGALLLSRWGLPEVLIESTANHHQPTLSPKPQMSVVVHLANCIAHEVGYSPGWLPYAARTDEAVFDALGMEADDIQQLLLETHESLQQVEELSQQGG